MPDVFTKSKRSEVMAKIHGCGNKSTELALIALFREHKIKGWRRNRPVYGKPDFVFPKDRLAIFVDGCFWHGCPEHQVKPKTNADFWQKKIVGNVARDEKVNKELTKMSWRVLRIWEHELRKKDIPALMDRLRSALTGKQRSEGIYDNEQPGLRPTVKS